MHLDLREIESIRGIKALREERGKAMKRPFFGIPYTSSGSMIVGFMQLLWSVIPLYNSAQDRSSSPFMNALIASGAGVEWLILMMSSGLMLVITSFMMFRSLRHAALVVSGAILLASFAPFITQHTWTPTVLSLPLLGMYCYYLLLLDVSNKNKRRGSANGDL